MTEPVLIGTTPEAHRLALRAWRAHLLYGVDAHALLERALERGRTTEHSVADALTLEIRQIHLETQARWQASGRTFPLERSESPPPEHATE